MEVTDPSVGVSLSFLSFLLFALLRANLVVSLPRTLRHDVDRSWKWTNTFVSWIHAFVAGSTAAYCFLADPAMLTSDLIEYVSPPCFVVVCFSVGYFVSDLVDIAVHGKLRLMWEVIVHHVVVILVLGYNLAYVTYIGYTVLGLLVEINTFFLHWRKLLQLSRHPRDRLLSRAVKAVNLITFAVFRGAVLSWIVYDMYVYHDRLSFVFCYLLLAPCMLALLVINPVLFWRLLRNDFLRKQRD